MQRQLFIERIGGLDNVHLAAIERVHHLDDLHGDRIPFRSEGPAVPGNEGNEPRAGAGCGKRVGIHRHIVILDAGNRGGADDLRRAGDVGAGLRRILDEGFQGRGEPINGSIPPGFLGVIGATQRLQLRGVAGTKDVQEKIFVAQCGVHELALEHQGAIGPAVGIQEESLGQMR